MVVGIFDAGVIASIFIALAVIACIILAMQWTGGAGKTGNAAEAPLPLDWVLRAIPLPVVVADRDLLEIRVNEAAALLLGMEVGKNLAGSGGPAPWEVFQDGGRLPGERLPLSRALRGEEVEDHQIELMFPDGRRLPLATSARPIRDERGQVLGVVCALQDLSENARLIREIELGRRRGEEAGILKDWRLAIAFHDIRSALNTVNLLAEILDHQVARPEGQDEELVKLAADMKTSTATLIKIIKSTLDLARSSDERPPLAESNFSLSALLLEEVGHHLPLAREKGLRLSIEKPNPPVWIRSDRLRLAHAMGVLIHHSLESTPAGTVTVWAGLNAEGSPEIRVIDTGGGLPPELERQLLDHLSRIRRDHQGQPEPGLAVLRKLAEAVDAKLSIENRPGEGATYKIISPVERIVRAPAPKAGAHLPTPAPDAGPKKAEPSQAASWWL